MGWGNDTDKIIQVDVSGEVSSKLDETNEKINIADKQVTNAYQNVYKSSTAVKGSTPQGTVVFIDDDGHGDVLAKLKDFAISKSVPWTIALYEESQILNNIPEVLDLQNNHGWEIAGHGDNYSSELTEAELHDHYKTLLGILRPNGFKVDNYIYAHGDYDDLAQKVASQYFRSASTVGQLVHNRYDKMKMYELVRINAPYTLYSTTLDLLKQRVDAAFSAKGLLLVTTHIWGMSETDLQMLSDLIDYIKSKNMPIKTLNDALDDFAPVTFTGYPDEYDYFHLLRNGKILSNRAKTKVMPENTYSPNTTLAEFEADTVTISAVNTSLATGLPNNTAGILTTYKIASSNAYSYQMYQEYNGSKMYIRTASTSGTWQAWNELAISRYGVNVVVQDNKYSASTPSSDFPDGITNCSINTAGASGLPNDTSGVLTTYKMYSASAYCYQIYKQYNSQKIYTRTASTSGAWQAWYEVVTSRFGAHVSDSSNSYSASSPIGDYPTGIVTFAVAGGGTTGFPGDSAGLVTTYKVYGNGFYRQEFRKYLSNEVWSRYVDANGTWTAWQKISAV